MKIEESVLNDIEKSLKRSKFSNISYKIFKKYNKSLFFNKF